VRLRLGQHAELLAELSGRARAFPLDERLSGQLMLACTGAVAAAMRWRSTRSAGASWPPSSASIPGRGCSG
jgi:hypothetical protein